jgi:hypothetical protein
MKTKLLSLLLFLVAGFAHADYTVFNSSNVATNVTNARLWVGRGTLHSVIVGKAGTSSTIDLYDGASSTNFIRKIGSLDTGSLRVVDFDVAVSSGLTFTTAGGATLQVIFKAGQ